MTPQARPHAGLGIEGGLALPTRLLSGRTVAASALFLLRTLLQTLRVAWRACERVWVGWQHPCWPPMALHRSGRPRGPLPSQRWSPTVCLFLLEARGRLPAALTHSFPTRSPGAVLGSARPLARLHQSLATRAQLFPPENECNIS